EVLKEKMLSEGWEMRFLGEDAFTGDNGVALQPSEGPLDRHLLLAGWRADQENSNLMAQLFLQGDAKQLEKLFMDDDAFCTCSLSTSKSEEENVETEYYFRLSGMSIVSAWDFTHAVWEAIGALCDGELVNPQEGLDEEE
ncbi:MAG TPA: hypothetical protein VF719_05550, partial [Abditibacteriaceae bacterium]